MEQDIKIKDSVRHDYCKDGVLREFGGVRIPPVVLEEVSIEFSRDTLSNALPREEGKVPFNLDEEEKYRVYLASGLDYPELWSAIPIKYEEDIDFGQFPEAGIISQTVLYNASRNILLIQLDINKSTYYLVYDYDMDEFTESYNDINVQFYDVPDELLLQLLPDNYNTDIISQTI